MRSGIKLVDGWGLNDADYIVKPMNADGTRSSCKIYSMWKDLIRRTKNEKHMNSMPYLMGNTIEDSWQRFSVFRLWVISQDWEGLQLDKDILMPGNKHYGPETCVFVPNYINSLFGLKKKQNGLPVGVRYVTRKDSVLTKPYLAEAYSGIKGDKYSQTFGFFSSPEPAHKAWQLAKASNIKEAIELYKTEAFYQKEVGNALQSRVDALLLSAELGEETLFI